MRALVTGASRGGIGGAVCRRLAGDAAASGDPLTLTFSTTGRSGGDELLTEELTSAGARAVRARRPRRRGIFRHAGPAGD